MPSEEEKAAFKEKWKKRREEIMTKMKDMTPEERQAFMKGMREKRGKGGGEGKKGGEGKEGKGKKRAAEDNDAAPEGVEPQRP